MRLRTGRPITAKTVKDNDLSALKTVFGWAVTNRKLKANPAAGITIKLGKPAKLRSKGFTDEEARALLKAASNYVPRGGQERPETTAAKRWVPWLCAFTGARVGEMVVSVHARGGKFDGKRAPGGMPQYLELGARVSERWSPGRAAKVELQLFTRSRPRTR